MFGLKAKLILAAIISVSFLALGAYTYVVKLQLDRAEADKAVIEAELKTAVDVNTKNAKQVETLQSNLRKQREATEKEIAATQERATAIDQIKKDMDNVSGANDPAGAYWDAFSERLRNAKRNH